MFLTELKDNLITLVSLNVEQYYLSVLPVNNNSPPPAKIAFLPLALINIFSHSEPRRLHCQKPPIKGGLTGWKY